MVEALKILGLIVIHGILFVMMGTIVNRLLGIKRSGGITIIIGFFSWYALQEIIYIPLLILRADIAVLMWEQIIAFAVILIVYIVGFRSRLITVMKNIAREFREALIVPIIFLAVTIVPALVMMSMSKGFESSYMHTISSAEMTAMTGSMYMYDSDTGRLLDSPVYMESLGVWNMSIAAWGSMFNMNIMKVVKYSMGVICLMLSVLVNLRIGRQLFKGDVKRAFVFAGTCILVMLFINIGDSPAAQLFMYGGTSKAYCANVLMPFIFYWAVRCRGRYKDAFDKRIIPVVIIGALAISTYSAIVAAFSMGAVILSDIIIARYNKIKGVEQKDADVA